MVLRDFLFRVKAFRFSVNHRIDALNKLFDRYETIQFEREMHQYVAANNSLWHNNADQLLFKYVNHCYQGGVILRENIIRMILRGSKLALFTYIILRCRFKVISSLSFRYFKSLNLDTGEILRYLVRTEVSIAQISEFIQSNNLSEYYRVFKLLMPDEVSLVAVDKYDSNNLGVIQLHTTEGKREVLPRIGSIKFREILVFKNANTYGQSSLIVRDEFATLPWFKFDLAAENVVRNDPYLLAISSRMILTRNLPNSDLKIPGSSISLSDADSHHFGHFVLEGLPRLNAFKFISASPLHSTIKIDAASRQFEPLIREIAPKHVIFDVTRGEGVNHEKLLVSTSSRFIASDLTYGSPFDFRDNAISHEDYRDWSLLNPGYQSRSINLSLLRKGTGELNYRKLINSEDLCTAMKQFNFQFVDSRNISYKNLKTMLSKSKIIVTEAGSSISLNLLFFDLNNVTLIFLQHPKLVNQESKLPGLFSSRGAKVHVIEGMGVGEERQSDYFIDAKIFENLLNETNNQG
jgi:hypothetical protein